MKMNVLCVGVMYSTNDEKLRKTCIIIHATAYIGGLILFTVFVWDLSVCGIAINLCTNFEIKSRSKNMLNAKDEQKLPLVLMLFRIYYLGKQWGYNTVVGCITVNQQNIKTPYLCSPNALPYELVQETMALQHGGMHLFVIIIFMQVQQTVSCI